MQGVTEGRIVHFVLPNGEHRAALIVRVFRGIDDGTVNLMVILDGGNDAPSFGLHSFSGVAHDDTGAPAHAVSVAGQLPFRWETSVHYSEEPQPRTWHWVESA